MAPTPGSCVGPRQSLSTIAQQVVALVNRCLTPHRRRPGEAIDEAGDVYVCDSFNFRIQKFDPLGVPIGQFGSQGDGQGTFEFPYGVAVSLAGFLYVTDPGLSLVQQFAPG